MDVNVTIKLTKIKVRRIPRRFSSVFEIPRRSSADRCEIVGCRALSVSRRNIVDVVYSFLPDRARGGWSPTHAENRDSSRGIAREAGGSERGAATRLRSTSWRMRSRGVVTPDAKR